ncbi:hypothetical protein AHMF7605_10535 [Adhaeribacter arboris]|uniref:Uncharacterized protein n=1 Tax=Adhaeribacter arboris TaxID=2072846 RepID=A0A2T2YEL0_9BACT|nr:hypothetical protein [Adhaeribacter arboris]PSR53923.1 hypothetical protein AHMF7605_10535 [Adhaeribacter arboris]
MESLNIWSSLILVIASIVSLVPIVRMATSLFSDKITLTHKVTGKSVTITRHYDEKVSKQLQDLIR